MDVVSEKDFLKHKGQESTVHRSRSVTFTPSITVPEPRKPTAIPDFTPSILSASPFNLDAPEFRPRANTLPSRPISQSLPTNIPSQLERHDDHRKKRSARGKRHETTRFFPALSKENLSDKVMTIQ